jgi:hypothetical protein
MELLSFINKIKIVKYEHQLVTTANSCEITDNLIYLRLYNITNAKSIDITKYLLYLNCSRIYINENLNNIMYLECECYYLKTDSKYLVLLSLCNKQILNLIAPNLVYVLAIFFEHGDLFKDSKTLMYIKVNRLFHKTQAPIYLVNTNIDMISRNK